MVAVREVAVEFEDGQPSHISTIFWDNIEKLYGIDIMLNIKGYMRNK